MVRALRAPELLYPLRRQRRKECPAIGRVLLALEESTLLESPHCSRDSTRGQHPLVAEPAHALATPRLADQRDEDPVIVEREAVVGAKPLVERTRHGLAQAEQAAPRGELLRRERVGFGRQIA